MIVRSSFGWASPYWNADPRKVFGDDFQCIYEGSIWNAAGLRERLEAEAQRPEFFLLGNFSHDRAALVKTCLEMGINHTHWEDGFFPHYETQHLDPVGFCWESSLPRMIFLKCADGQRERAQKARAAWLGRPSGALPAAVRKPFVLWPLQLLGDQVNRCDMNVRDWSGLIRDFRRRLPDEFQLVLKEHPLSAATDLVGVEEVLRECPNTIVAPRGSSLSAILRECRAVAGANSSVLYEARLMHHVPVFAYGRSWFTNHPELFQPLAVGTESGLPHEDWLENPGALRTEYLEGYTNWFLAQLLTRQIDRRELRGAEELRQAVWRLSHEAYRGYGDEVFAE